jgi:arylsulfatase A-like enzyme
MNRHLMAVILVLIGLALLAPPLGLRAAPAPERPNILFILTDDQDARSIASMPKLKALLVDRGTTFQNFFVTYALCCPSRASILRGQYPHNHQVLTNRPPSGGFEKFLALGHEASTIATWLRAGGYRTALLGKYLNGYPDAGNPAHVPPGWDEWDSPAGGNPYSNVNYRLNENGRIVTYGRGAEDYLTDVLARKASDFIRRGAQIGRPFFIYLGTYAPHAPATPAPRHEGTFADARAPRSPSFNEADVSDKPSFIRGRAELSPRAMEQIDEHYRKRLQSLQAVDDLVASLVEVLRVQGELQGTYIVFTSDNGFHLGEHRLPIGKNTAYEEDIRVPAIVRGPGVPEGRVLPHLALNIDLAPTFAELAGLTPPGFVDGRSLVPLIAGGPPALARWRQTFLVEHYTQAQPAGAQAARRARADAIPEYQAFRAGDYVYVEYATGERELYDLVRDPFELQNRFTSADPALVGQLRSYLATLRRCAGSSCRAAEDVAPPSIPGR